MYQGAPPKMNRQKLHLAPQQKQKRANDQRHPVLSIIGPTGVRVSEGMRLALLR
jgi:hypothetical protein